MGAERGGEGRALTPGDPLWWRGKDHNKHTDQPPRERGGEETGQHTRLVQDGALYLNVRAGVCFCMFCVWGWEGC